MHPSLGNVAPISLLCGSRQSPLYWFSPMWYHMPSRRPIIENAKFGNMHSSFQNNIPVPSTIPSVRSMQHFCGRCVSPSLPLQHAFFVWDFCVSPSVLAGVCDNRCIVLISMVLWCHCTLYVPRIVMRILKKQSCLHCTCVHLHRDQYNIFAWVVPAETAFCEGGFPLSFVKLPRFCPSVSAKGFPGVLPLPTLEFLHPEHPSAISTCTDPLWRPPGVRLPRKLRMRSGLEYRKWIPDPDAQIEKCKQFWHIHRFSLL